MAVAGRETALANLKAARDLCEKWVPDYLKETAPPRRIPAAAAGRVFWKVVGDLAGHSRRLAARGGK